MRNPFISASSSSEQPTNPKSKKSKKMKSPHKFTSPPSPKTVLPSSRCRPHALDAASPCSPSSSTADLPLSPKDAPSTSSPSRSGSTDVTREELELVLRRLGGGGEDEVAAMIAEADRNGDGRLSIEELSMLIGQEEQEEELREVFGVFDADGDGRISEEELRGAFAMLGDGSFSVDDCRRMIREVDSVGGGFVCFPDFARMMVMDGQR